MDKIYIEELENPRGVVRLVFGNRLKGKKKTTKKKKNKPN